MKILVIGASGLIGSELAGRLEWYGHLVHRSVRSEGSLEHPRIDYAQLPSHAELVGMLRDYDVVVNSVGIFAEKGNQTFDSLHVKGPTAIFRAAMDAGVGLIVQISALGADSDSAFGYLASKGEADERLEALPIRGLIVRPSLVFSPQGPSTLLFAKLAALPVTPLPGGGDQRIQPIHLEDLIEAVARIISSGMEAGLLNAVGPQALSIKSYLALFKEGAGTKPRFFPMPTPLLRPLLRVAGRLPGSPIASEQALGMLEANSVAEPDRVASALGRLPRPPQTFVVQDARAIRTQVVLSWMLLSMRISLAAMWLATAWVSVFAYPVSASLAMLGKVGLTGFLAVAALYGAAALDAVFGLATLFMRRRRTLYVAQAILVILYTVIISLWLPEYWSHPFGPVLKNVPILAMVFALIFLDRDHGHRTS